MQRHPPNRYVLLVPFSIAMWFTEDLKKTISIPLPLWTTSGYSLLMQPWTTESLFWRWATATPHWREYVLTKKWPSHRGPGDSSTPGISFELHQDWGHFGGVFVACYHSLGAGFWYVLFSARKLGKIPILTSIFFKWAVQPATSSCIMLYPGNIAFMTTSEHVIRAKYIQMEFFHLKLRDLKLRDSNNL